MIDFSSSVILVAYQFVMKITIPGIQTFWEEVLAEKTH